MKVYIQGLLFSVLVACAYYFIDARFFSLDIMRSIRTSFFTVFKSRDYIDDNIFLYNIGTMADSAVVNRVRELLKLNPRAVDINACDLLSYNTLEKAFSNDPRVVIASCENEGPTPMSSIVMEGNTVTHFVTSADRFEIRLAGSEELRARGNEMEMINCNSNGFYQSELTEIIYPESPEDAIFLVGYMGDQLSMRGDYSGSGSVNFDNQNFDEDGNDLYYFKSSRITPLNKDFGRLGASPDSYDIEISANIISTIRGDNYIAEVPLWLRVSIIFIVCVLNAAIIMWVKTRWIILNVVMYVFLFFLLIMASSLAMVYLFASNIYLNLDGLEVLLLMVSVFTVFSTSAGKKAQVATV